MQDNVKRKFKLLITLILLFGGIAQANDKVLLNPNPDSAYLEARNLAISKEYASCRALCYNQLQDYPGYHDFRILASRTLAWEGNYDSARVVINPVLETEPSNKEAILALTDFNIWEQLYYQALAVVDTGLFYIPQDSQLLVRRKDILNKLDSTLLIVQQNDTINFSDSNAIGISYFFDFFKKPYIARRHMVSFGYTRKFKRSTAIGNLNIGNNVLNGGRIFEKPSFQLNFSYYPKITNDSYLYLNYGAATGNFFPTHRAGIEYFKGIGEGFELSGGMRYMYWDNSIYFFTASVSKYLNNYWLSFRPFFTISDNNTSTSYLFEARRYLKPVNSYIFLLFGFGDSPDQPLTLANEFGNFKSTRYNAGFTYRLNRMHFGAAMGYQYEEYFVKKYRNRINFTLNLAYVF